MYVMIFYDVVINPQTIKAHLNTLYRGFKSKK